MTTRGSIVILAYSNGKMIQGDEGDMYDGPDPTMFRISSFLVTFEFLKQKIHSVLNLEAANQAVSKVAYRIPISPNKYKAVQLTNDEDVRCMLASHAKQPIPSTIELYIDMNTRQTRLSQSQTSAGDRSRSQLTIKETREHTITWDCMLRNGDANGVVNCKFDDHRRCPPLGARQTRGSLQGGSLKGGSLGSGKSQRGK